MEKSWTTKFANVYLIYHVLSVTTFTKLYQLYLVVDLIFLLITIASSQHGCPDNLSLLKTIKTFNDFLIFLVFPSLKFGSGHRVLYPT
jgi:hypothetical protein